jgi:gentisate 1,2-dioxygenase
MATDEVRQPGYGRISDAHHRCLRAAPRTVSAAARIAVRTEWCHRIEGGGRLHRRDTIAFAAQDLSSCRPAHTSSADADTVLFSFSDRPVQRALGLWREQLL